MNRSSCVCPPGGAAGLMVAGDRLQSAVDLRQLHPETGA